MRSASRLTICPGSRADRFVWDKVCGTRDRKSTRLNSSHLVISYAVFCLKKKKKSSSEFLTSRGGASLGGDALGLTDMRQARGTISLGLWWSVAGSVLFSWPALRRRTAAE